jgi:DNA-binding PadR family transcriptional regulator
MRGRPRSSHGDLWRGLIQLHVLHHASEGDVYGLGLIEELRRHGDSIGPGTLYPLRHRLTERGSLDERAKEGGRQRRYDATAKGRRALGQGYCYVKELFEEMTGPETRGKDCNAHSAESEQK